MHQTIAQSIDRFQVTSWRPCWYTRRIDFLSVGNLSLSSNPKVPPNTRQPEWCIYGVCRPMTTPEENKCCRKRVCVTSYELCQNICIDREVLTVAIRARCDTTVEEPDYASKRVVQGGSLARFTNRKNSESRITAIKISFSQITKINK